MIRIRLATTLLPDQANNHCFPSSRSVSELLEFPCISDDLSSWLVRIGAATSHSIEFVNRRSPVRYQRKR